MGYSGNRGMGIWDIAKRDVKYCIVFGSVLGYIQERCEQVLYCIW